MPHEPQVSDLAAEIQELRQQVQGLVAACKEFFALQGPLPFSVNPLFCAGWPSYPLPRDTPPFWEWLESRFSEKVQEHPIKGWNYLVYRQHPWRRQPYLKDRNMTVRQLVGTVKANQWDEDQAAKNLDLPVEAIREAFRYAQENRELLDFELAYERLILAVGCAAPGNESEGKRRGTAALP